MRLKSGRLLFGITSNLGLFSPWTYVIIMKSAFFALLSSVCVAFAVADCSVPDSSKVDCGYVGITESQCQASGCCYAQASNSAIPWCFKQAGSGNCFGYQVNYFLVKQAKYERNLITSCASF